MFLNTPLIILRKTWYVSLAYQWLENLNIIFSIKKLAEQNIEFKLFGKEGSTQQNALQIERSSKSQALIRKIFGPSWPGTYIIKHDTNRLEHKN